MFHFPTFPPDPLCVQGQVTGHDSSWVSPFGNPRITARLPTSRGLSQAPTSFIGSWCQGIHHVPLVACHLLQRCSRPLCSSQDTGGSACRSALTTRSRETRWQFAGEAARRGDRKLDPSGPNSAPDGSTRLTRFSTPGPPK